MYMCSAYGCLYNSKQMKLKEEYSGNDCCLLSSSLFMDSHILKQKLFTALVLSRYKTIRKNRM